MTAEISKMGRKEVLDRAKKHIFSTGVNDVASHLCRWNMRYGLAKFHVVQEKFGLDPNATFISAPDETITRNKTRWNNGVGYGGKVSWGSGEDKLVILDVMPNACGMLVGGLEELPSPNAMIEAIHSLRGSEASIDDVRIEWDFEKGNHFINVYEIAKAADVELPEYAFIIHSGTPEFKGEGPKGLGLYFHKSEALQSMAKSIDTPFGPCQVLLDGDAVSYLEFYKYAEQFSRRRRSLAAKEVFGKYDEIVNVTHQGLVNYNEVCLGCHDVKDGNGILPIALRGDLPAYLIRGRVGFDDETLEALGFWRRGEKYGVIDRLRRANLVPHGSGYTFPDMLNVVDVVETVTKRYFIVDMAHGMSQKIVSDVEGLQFSYRGREVIVRALELGIADIVARLMPIFVLKI